jgi:hypothetical protein
VNRIMSVVMGNKGLGSWATKMKPVSTLIDAATLIQSVPTVSALINYAEALYLLRKFWETTYTISLDDTRSP